MDSPSRVQFMGYILYLESFTDALLKIYRLIIKIYYNLVATSELALDLQQLISL
jgi:hypothetical protein